MRKNVQEDFELGFISGLTFVCDSTCLLLGITGSDRKFLQNLNQFFQQLPHLP